MKTYTQGLVRKVIAGEGAIAQIADAARSFNARNITLITDAGVYKLGLTKKPEQILKDAGFSVIVINDVPPEPSVAQVNAIFDKAKGHGCDLLVAIGGGSSIDTTKLVSLMLRNDLTLEQMVKGGKPTARGVPTLMVPTTAGTGAEATPNAIVLVPEENLKVGIVSELMIADCVILDPEMTSGLPPAITANTGIDALCHLMECYISKKANPFSDTLALSGISMIGRSIRECFNNGGDLEARAQMLQAALYGGLCIASSGTTAIHALSYPLGGTYHIPHGLANAILMPLVMDFNRDSCPDRYADIARAMGIKTEGRAGEQICDELVGELYKLNSDLRIRCDLKARGITPDAIPSLVEGAAKVTRLLDNNPKAMSKDDMRAIYEKLLAANA
ncbi:MAG: iron-containing alcohol dehydrogenase [Succinivibrio sp.]